MHCQTCCGAKGGTAKNSLVSKCRRWCPGLELLHQGRPRAIYRLHIGLKGAYYERLVAIELVTRGRNVAHHVQRFQSLVSTVPVSCFPPALYQDNVLSPSRWLASSFSSRCPLYTVTARSILFLLVP